MKKNNTHTILSVAYICLLLVYTAIREILPLNFLIDNTFVSIGIFIPGLVLILFDLFKNRKCINGHSQDLLILFMIVCIISSIINIQLGLFDNLKFLATLCIEFLVVFCFSKNLTKDEIDKHLNIISLVFIITWFIPVIVSLSTYFFNIDIIITGEGAWGEKNQGFSNEYVRLWGIFQDQNYASATSIVCILASVRLLFSKIKMPAICFNIINIISQITFIILGGSRAAMLLLFLSTAIFSAYFYIHKKKIFNRVATGFVSTAIVTGLVIALFFGIKTILPVMRVKEASNSSAISSAFNKLYDASGLDYTISNEIEAEQTQPQEAPPTTEPSTQQPTENITTQPSQNTLTSPNTQVTQPSVQQSLDRADANKEDVSNGRFKRWKQTIEIFLNAPIFGTSPRNLVPFARLNNTDTIIAKFKIAPHNGYLDVLVETGVVGFLVLAVSVIYIVLSTLKRYLKDNFNPSKAFLISSVVALAGVAMFISDIFMLFSINATLFWLLLGCAFNYDKAETNNGCLYTIFNKIFKKSRIDDEVK